MEVCFYYGIMSDPLEEQANKQGFTLGDKAELLEKIRYSINICNFHVATESQVKAMTTKLHKQVMNSVKPIKKKGEDNENS